MKKRIAVLLLLLLVLPACAAEPAEEPEPLRVRESVIMEAGERLPETDAFLEESFSGSLALNADEVNVLIPGTYPVTLITDGEVYSSSLEVRDTVSPVLECTGGCFPRGELAPAVLVTKAEDATALSFSFLTVPDPEAVGAQPVTVEAVDLGGNRAEAEAVVTFFDAELELEATAEPITDRYLLLKLGYGMEGDAESLLEGGFVGEELVTVALDGSPFVIRVRIADSLPPSAEPVFYEGCCGYPLTPEKLVTDIQDASELSVEFAEPPDWNAEGTAPVTVRLTDSWGNCSEIVSEISLIRDTEAPVIYMARDFYGYTDSAISYFGEIFAEDNADPDVLLTVDKSQVNPRKAGTYPVTYTAVDRAGNATEAVINLILTEQKLSDEQLDEAAQAVLGSILTEDMNTAEKVRAVYEWSYRSMRYTWTSDKTDFNSEAYKALTTHAGDCFTYYAGVYSLLTRIEGVQVLSVQRWNSQRGGAHYWCLVNIENTGWYHLDTINVSSGYGFSAFMRTTEELRKRDAEYWRFDTELYPETAQEPFDMTIWD